MPRKTILAIDDAPDQLRALSICMRAAGYDLACATDGVMAMTVARQVKPDLILLDIGLPGGDGFVVLERLQTNPLFFAIPVIVISGREPQNNRERARKGGAVAYFQKPANGKQLLSTIREALRESAAAVHS